MSGHSKWATTHRAKSTADAKRGAVFTKLARAITTAARVGDNPDANFKLRLAIDQARAANMPKDNIARAIARATGQGGDAPLESVTYEGFGPHGVAILVECLTDNRNRTSQEIRHLLEAHGGRVGAPGSVQWQFARTAAVSVPQLTEAEELSLIDLGAQEIRRTGRAVTVTCTPNTAEAIRQRLASADRQPQVSTQLTPRETQPLPDEAAKAAVVKLLDAFDDHPDVQGYTHNAAL